MSATVELRITPAGELRGREVEAPGATPAKLRGAFAEGVGEGLLHLGGPMLGAELSRALAFGRSIARAWYEAICRAGTLDATPPDDVASSLLLAIPPMLGAEYATPRTIADAWAQMRAVARAEADGHELASWLATKNEAWHGIGRVYFHLAENPRDPEFPFAFVGTYVDGLAASGEPLHRTLAHALRVFESDREALLRLLRPLDTAANGSTLVKQLVESGSIYRAVRWTPQEAFAFLEQIPACEGAGVLVRVPNWWRTQTRRVRATARVGQKTPSGLGADALLDFDVALTLDGDRLTAKEIASLLEGTPGLRLLRGKWVAVDPQQLRDALRRFEEVQAEKGLSFADGMRLLAGVTEGAAANDVQEIVAGKWLDTTLARLRDPSERARVDPGAKLRGTLRAYQRDGALWLRALWELRLGGCLADDMGLGKTIQVLALLLGLPRRDAPHLLVVPTSLVANWQAEAEKFAPKLKLVVAHRSAAQDLGASEVDDADAVVTTYGTLLRTAWLRERAWGLVVLDEAQAIKNAGTQQARAVKALRSTARLALTGTPVENRLDDLWSLFDFLAPGLLGSAAEFGRAVKKLDRRGEGFAPIRRLVAPYILRRLKTDPAIVPDLPDKTEVDAWCGLSPLQIALYEQSVKSLAQELRKSEGVQRRGIVLSYLQRFKQICNHPSHWTRDGSWDPAASGKFERLRAIAESLAARQERALVFTQFRELTAPLAAFLEQVFGQPGFRLDGRTPVRRRQELVNAFAAEDGPPFFVISLKAGGTGLNLTAASQVIHFDRWWNPAVENQATDRAYRIGQHRNVLVHKLVCRGTLEEKIDAMIRDKQALANEILAEDGAVRLTEMSDAELLRTVKLDLRRAVDGA